MSDNSLLEKLETFYIRFREIGQLITDPEVIQDMNRFVKLNKEYRDLEQVVEAGDELKSAVKSYDEAQEILDTETDKELREMAEMEIEELETKIPELESKVKMLLVPADPEDSKNVILEIRVEPGEMRPVSSPGICSVCIPSSASQNAGKWRLPIIARELREDTRRSWRTYQVTACTES